MTRSIEHRARHTPRVSLKGSRIYWEPSASLRRAGFKGVPLGLLSIDALNQADALNAKADEHIETSDADRSRPDTIASVLDDFEASDEFKQKSARTQSDRKRYYRRARKDIGHFNALQLTTLRMQTWYRDLSKASVADAIEHVSSVKVAFSWAVREKKMASNPATDVDMPARESRQRIGTRDELWAMVKALDSLQLPSISAISITTAGTMQRIGDVRSLITTNARGGQLSLIQSKTKRPLTFRLHSLIVDRLGDIPNDPAPLFRSERTGRAWHERAFNRAWSRARELAAKELPSLIGADPNVNEHVYQGDLQARDLRRTGMVWAAQAGATVPQICSVSGHSIEEGMKILETYLPRHQLLADQAIIKMDMVKTPSLDRVAESIAIAL
ncbi:hypothetical protein [uncultured Ruegeria sp.]|uniref:tyrosine-type recombinase/integrase n=1 Tax=uncultured Ruegeria sp. TaxID=259304 RepID=UPI002631DCD3|nr:hypothetical protein [uncultured Ruegeria sp.]